MSSPLSYGERLRKARKAKGLTQREVAQAVHVKEDAVSAWENDTHEPRPPERRALARLFAELAEPATAAQDVRISNRGVDSTLAQSGTKGQEAGTPASGRLLDMKEAAARIAKSLELALRKSELVVDVNRPKELERQRALVWALKDLARQLKRLGYSMDELFDTTDDIAAEIGLPRAQRCANCNSIAPPPARFCPHCGTSFAESGKDSS